MNEDLLEMLTPDDLPPEQRDLAEVVGIEGYRRLLRVYGGTGAMYIPQPDRLLRSLRDDLIRREYDGRNVYALARKWELTDAYIRSIVREKAQELHRSPMDGQISLFDVPTTKNGQK